MTPALRISNRDARRLWLTCQGLAASPTGPIDLGGIINGLGFVQLDTIQIVSRAHHHILWSRNQNYREPMLNRHLADERGVFEHFTHDASVIPMSVYPMWRRQFRRLEAKVRQWEWHRGMLDGAARRGMVDRIRAEGPLSTHAFDTKIVGEKTMWKRPPHKLALDYLWYAGELSTSHREGFTKVYDLTERVIPQAWRDLEVEDAAAVDGLCEAALSRLGFGDAGEIQRFWGATERAEVVDWCDGRRDLVPVEYETADGAWRTALALPDIEARLSEMGGVTSRLRILNPFDPVIRDRMRLSRLFGFDYTVEMFVPSAKRVWGYYVFPVLEGDRFVGRIEIKADRKAGRLTVLNLWAEQGAVWTRGREEKVEAELARMARFVGAETVDWSACRIRPQVASAV